MPSSALRPCSQPGCSTLVKSGRCTIHSHDRVIRDPDIKRLYNSARWKRIRTQQLALAIVPSLADYPLCVECLSNRQLVEATEVDHVYPHRGDEGKFYSGPFQALCKRHHSSKTKRELGL